MDMIDTARLKCGKIQGMINGVIKDRVTGLRDVLECLIDKIEMQGDTQYYKTRNMEVTVENKRLKKEVEKLVQIKSQKEKEIEGIRMKYEEMEDKYIQAEKRIEKDEIQE